MREYSKDELIAKVKSLPNAVLTRLAFDDVDNPNVKPKKNGKWDADAVDAHIQKYLEESDE